MTQRIKVVNVTLYEITCCRCGGCWRSKTRRPLRCGKCKTPYYNVPKKK